MRDANKSRDVFLCCDKAWSEVKILTDSIVSTGTE